MIPSLSITNSIKIRVYFDSIFLSYLINYVDEHVEGLNFAAFVSEPISPRKR